MSERRTNQTVIDVGPRKKFRWRLLLGLGLLAAIIAASRLSSVYLSALWFSSLGYSSVYWYIFKAKSLLFIGATVLTALVLSATFWLFQRLFGSYAFEQRTIVFNNQTVQFSPAKFIRPLGWLVAVLFGLIYGFSVKDDWQRFSLYYYQPPTTGYDPIFNKPLGFYLFSLPFYESLNSWLIGVTFIILFAAVGYLMLSLPQQVLKPTVRWSSGAAFRAVCCALALFLMALSFRAYLARFPYLWKDHQTFSGVTFTEAHYVLPSLMLVAIALLIGAGLALINGFFVRRIILLAIAIALPLAVYIVGVGLVPSYVQSFVVKPNELDRESPYITHNIEWTRRAFALDDIELRDFDAETTVEGLDIANNKDSLENIRLWDLGALQNTLKQIQAIRIYYDFPDVGVDRYPTPNGPRQVMVAPREMNDEKLPSSSRNWINERLIYTHGYGLTMNTANGFTPEGLPQFLVSNMPVEIKGTDVKVTRPEIYFGKLTNNHVYVRTRQKEFDYPQGDTNASTTYEGTGGIKIGGSLRRSLLAWSVGDLSKLPFSDDVTSDSRILIRRTIQEIVNGVAPFLRYDDKDAYMVVNSEGRLFWIMDAFTESRSYPYSTHHDVDGKSLNYIRNSVKVVLDAYNGTATFYVFDQQDPLINAYRKVFPTLFVDAASMPADLRAHIRYPEVLIKVQAEAFSLYHTQNPKVFFQREDVWSLAQQVVQDEQGQRQSTPIDPYYVMMKLPGEEQKHEFVLIYPFTPASKNNLTGWMAGRSDGENYGKLLVYNFPKSRLIDGPLQIEARIDQNAQLSSQFTLWNQQGSRVIRGHLLVVPIGRSLLYVEPVYLQAQRSPMPELRLVVLATQDKLAYGQNFTEAVNNLFGDLAKPPTQSQTQPTTPQQEVKDGNTTTTPAAPGLAQLVTRALQEFDDYQRLTAQGKLAEAGQKLEQHKRTLEEIRKLTRE
jgi:uncharacterized membrane protein (UPF0182 family)